MLVSFNWLKQYVNLPKSLTPEELALKLTMSTVEVEGIHNQAKNLDNIVVGEIKKIEKHSNADKLKLVDVNIGKENIRVVCGGSNLKKGMKVALGKVGAKVKWHGEGELVELEKTEIRGEKSAGMICASSEIGLESMYPAKDDHEIIDLGSIKAKNGASLSEALGISDTVIDIDNKSMTHRPDLWGHYGLAREVGALYGMEISAYEPPKIEDQKIKKSKNHFKLKVDVHDHDLCPRYMGVVIDGIKVGPSPEWMQKLLMSVGLRPINNIVDITNFILYDLGQPMHCFDANHVSCNIKHVTTIDVRKAKKGEKIIALDGCEYEFTPEMLVIADEKKPIAIAGVIGGEETSVNEKTTTIIFESANFDATSVRRTSMALGMRTDSSARFEKSLDPNNAELALRRAVQLTLEICPEAKVVSSVVDESKFSLSTGPIELSLEFLNKKIGIEIEKKKVVEILESLGFGVQDKKDRLSVMVPTWRATKDISIPEDLVEEVARIYGYDNIDVSLPTFPVEPPPRNELRILENKIKKIMSLKYGFTESYNYSFVSPRLLQKLDIDVDKFIELDNPIDKTRPYLRRSLLPNLLENAEKNLHSFDEVRLFELGKVFYKEELGEKEDKKGKDLLPRQDSLLSVVYASKNDKIPFFEVSSSLVSMLESFGFSVDIEKSSDIVNHLHPGRQASLLVYGQVIGLAGELHPVNQNKLGVKMRIAVGTIDINKILEFYKEKSSYKLVPQYPPMMRDIAFVVDQKIEHAELVQAIKKVDNLIETAELFDVFESEKLGKGKKSVAYHIVYQASDRTLEAGNVDRAHTKVEKMLGSEFGAEVRK